MIQIKSLLLAAVLSALPIQHASAEEYKSNLLSRNAGAIADVFTTYQFTKGGWAEANPLYNGICGYHRLLDGINVGTPEYKSAAKKFAACVAVVRIGIAEAARYGLVNRAAPEDREKVARTFDRTVNAFGFGAACYNAAMTKELRKNPNASSSSKSVAAGALCAGASFFLTSDMFKRAVGMPKKKRNRKFRTQIYLKF